MAVGEYLKTASAYLARASQAKHQEADGRRREITLKDQEMRQHIDQLEQQVRARQGLLASGKTDNHRRPGLLREIQELENQIQAVRRNFDNAKAHIAAEVDAMESQARNLQSQADNFSQQAGTS